jgi:omega-hydroxy-beta-dihydromenaquinone-9 sulfotransferase
MNTVNTDPGDAMTLPAYPFILKYRWSLRNNLLSGITTPQFLNILCRHRSAIAWTLYWHRILFLFLISIPNTILGIIEHWLFHDKIEAQELHEEPVFVVGHPRTGTTLIQNMMCQDPNYIYVDTYQAGFPSAFLFTQKFNWALSWLIDDTRPMDSMALSFTTPAEDEIAVNMLTSGISPYMCLTFMSKYKDSLKYATFDHRVCLEKEREEWIAAFLYFLKKVTLSASGKNRTNGSKSSSSQPKPLIIKSPVHIGRLPILRKLFPRAKFIFIHRDPFDVFRSSTILAQEYFYYCFLDKPTAEDITNYTLEQHAMLYDVYLKERPNLLASAVPVLAEVAFSDLESDAVGTLRRVYKELQISGFDERVAPVLEGYVEQLKGFKKNKLPNSSISPKLRQRLKIELAPVMKAFNYSAKPALLPRTLTMWTI